MLLLSTRSSSPLSVEVTTIYELETSMSSILLSRGQLKPVYGVDIYYCIRDNTICTRSSDNNYG